MRRPLLPLLGFLAGCGAFADSEHWSEQLTADSPCYQVDLLDGLDESSTAELRNLYDCVNKQGHFEPLAPTVAELESATSRDGVPAGIELVRAVNKMPEIDIDPFAVGGILLDGLRDPEIDLHAFLDVGIELIYGRTATEVRNDPDSHGDLSNSVLAPLGPALPAALTILLDDDLEAAVWLGDLLVHPETKRWLRTGSAYLESSDPAIRDPLASAIPNLGFALLAAQSPGNDRWSGASGNSLRDLAVEYIVREDPVLVLISPDIAPLVSDTAWNEALQTELVALHAGGHLQATPAQLAWMASVDLNGNPLTDPNEPSALYRFLRLLGNANEPMDCQIDLWIVTFDFSFGNLAVTVLEIIADMNPSTAQNTAGIIALLTDNVVADWMLHETVDLGVCPTLSHELVDDLVAVDVLTEPEATDLLTVVVEVLDVSKNRGTTNHIPDLANALEKLHENGGTEPLEELFRDIGEERLVSDLVEIVPILADPAANGITAGTEEAVDLADALGLLEWAVAIDPDDGRTGFEWLRPLLMPILEQDGTWDALDRAGALMRTEDSALAGILDLIPPMLELDPELTLLDHLGPVLGQTQVSGPLLRALEAPGVLDSLLATTPVSGQDEAPIAFLGRLLADGTFDDLLALVDLVIGDLGGALDAE